MRGPDRSGERVLYVTVPRRHGGEKTDVDVMGKRKRGRYSPGLGGQETSARRPTVDRNAVVCKPCFAPHAEYVTEQGSGERIAWSRD
jgi:hypothetical protein